MLRAAEADSYSDALAMVAWAVTEQLLKSMKASRMTMKAREISKPDRCVAMLRRSGLDRLLVEGWMHGRVSYQAADRHLNRLREALSSRSLSTDEVKFGILAFDGAAQRLCTGTGMSGPFEYPASQNHARDSLLTFARALHR